MSFIGNFLWVVFGGGLITWFLWVVTGCLFAITIVGIPFAKAAFRISGFALLPFGKELVDGRLVGEERRKGTGFVSFLWIILAGFWLALAHAVSGAVYCITIIGIPWELAHFKLAKVSYAPLGKKVVSAAVAKAATARAAECELNEKLGER